MITSKGLRQLGFEPRIDFELYDNRDGKGAQIEWFSNEPQPSESEIAVGQDAWNAEQVARQEKLDSVKSKLEALGLTTEEVKTAFGI
jgi:hypothetical protein|tara:strand:+ start:53 stop:313 length:261 start_codon:yes stop_codon:yes gene_type:complete